MNTSNEVYFSSLLKTDYPKVYRAIVDVLDRHSIKHGLLEGTRDYWCRDYMPVQSGFHDYIQFVYHPDYLKKVNTRQIPLQYSIMPKPSQA